MDELLEPRGQVAARGCAARRGRGEVEVARGRPADALAALGDQVDLLVIGSRRWGTAARVLLGSTGEAPMNDARCPVMVVPRLAAENGAPEPASLR